MKYQTTSRAIKDGYHRIISVGYCDLQNLLNYESPIAYNKGVYGWNYDVYGFGNTAIVTGYRSMPSKNSKADYDLVRLYDSKAEGKTKAERSALLLEFLDKASV